MRLLLTALAVIAFATPLRADPLDGILIEPEVDAVYSRSMYGSWRDDDGDCMNTRHEVLAAESLMPPTYSSNGCSVVGGLWFGPFTELTFTNPSDVDIDHLVALKEAHESGAWAWSTELRREFANDLLNPGHLIAVDDGTNQSKGARDPAEWLPPNQDFHCAYVLAWIEVKREWLLSIDPDEEAAIRAVLQTCPQ